MKTAYLLLAAAALTVSADVFAQAGGRRISGQIPAEQAQDFIGSNGTVCGKVESANYAQNAAGEPTFLHLGAAFRASPSRSASTARTAPTSALPPKSSSRTR